MAKKSGSPPNREIAEVWTAMQNMEHSHEQEKKRLLRISEISLILDSYDDLFTQFDPRQYSERALSQDFLGEIKRGSRDKVSGYVELTLLVPSAIKDPNREMVIEKRLKNHFEKHYEQLKKEARGRNMRAAALVLVGALMAVGAAFITEEGYVGLFWTLIIILLETTGVFFIWTTLDDLVNSRGDRKPELEFYKKMSTCQISFLPY